MCNGATPKARKSAHAENAISRTQRSLKAGASALRSTFAAGSPLTRWRPQGVCCVYEFIRSRTETLRLWRQAIKPTRQTLATIATTIPATQTRSGL